jgi:UDP-N-acetylglucosamine--N-acetylmuramyl-(pentapeptide) pyrophosphoryl-undecaprenol N-acetylglucosamine transferase
VRPSRRAGPATRASPTYALIAGGGTGGHVLPAIAIAQALVTAGHPAESIHFVGSKRGLERRLVPAAGFAVTLLPGRGVARRMTAANIGAVAGTLLAVVRAIGLVARRHPAVVVSVGGYASVPGVVGAVVLRVPLVVAEQNAVPGLANRLAGRFAKAAAVSFAGTPLPRTVVTGNPVRPELQHVDRSPAGRRAARRRLGLPEDVTVIAVSGGSLGARRINTAVVGLAAAWASRACLAIYHVVGERDADALAAECPAAVPGGLLYRQVRFEDRMDLLYGAADLAVQRAGASTVFELAATGVPSVLVPLPGAPGDHQTANARRLESAGAAVVVPDRELDTARLAAVRDDLLADRQALEAMGRAATTLARPEAAAAVAALAERWARG